MNLRALEYLIALSKQPHFAKAAAACNVTQPTLSMQLKKLEQSLGVTLVERNRRNLRLTQVGQAVCRHAEKIQQQIAEIKALTERSQNPLATTVNIGVIPTVAPYLLPLCLPGLQRELPQLKVYWLEAQTALLLDDLQQARIDAAILALPVDVDCQVSVLLDEPFLLAVPQQHAWARYADITQSALQRTQLMLLEEGHCLRDQALALCQKAKAAKPQAFQATSLETLRYMVASGLGMTLMPQLAMRRHDGIHYIPFKAPQPSRRIALLWRNSSAHSLLFTTLAAVMKKRLSTLQSE